MILQITIKNFAIISNLSIDFKDGLNVFTGETGSGKSIIIDAINFVLGNKVDKTVIKEGKDKVFVEAIFSIDNKKQIDILNKIGIEFEDIIIISREITNQKKLIKINGRTVLVSNVRAIGNLLVDFNDQKESNKLLETSSHIHYVDMFLSEKGKNNLLNFKKLYNDYLCVEKQIKEIRNLISYDKNIDFINFQINEIESSNLKIGEDSYIEDKIKMLSSAETIKKIYTDAYVSLKDDQENEPILSRINHILNNFKLIENDFKNVKEIRTMIEESYYLLEQATYNIASIPDDLNYNETQLIEFNERLNLIFNLKKKYGNDIKDILDTCQSLKKIKEETKDLDYKLMNLIKSKEVIINKINNLGHLITLERKKSGDNLRKKIIKELVYLGLPKCDFKVDFKDKYIFDINGFDNIQFLISTNIGSSPKPINKIASCGELSRIMLSLKVVFSKFDDIPSLIFDEIDTGISGQIAQFVSEKIFETSISHQIFCITHLPQMASMSDNHYLVSKVVIDNMTDSKIELLSHEKKLKEVARIISGNEITEVTILAADELIKKAKENKKRIIRYYKN